MANKTIKGLTVEIGGDTTKLGKALEKVEKQSRDLSGELGQINKLLKFDPGNSDLLAQKQKVLAEAIAATSDKLDTLKQAEQQVQAQFEKGEASEAQVRALQREILEATKKLSGYEKAAAETADELKRMGKAADGAADEIEDVGDESEDAAREADDLGSALDGSLSAGLTAVTALATAAVGAIVGCIEASADYRREMGKLKTAFDQNGFSAEVATDAYKEVQSVIGDTDQAVEAVNHLSQLVDTEQELAYWTGDILPGVYAQFGASLPIEGLTEAANETAKTGQVTGALADALNWAADEGETFGVSLMESTDFVELEAEELENLTEAQLEEYEARKAQQEEVDEWNEAILDATTAEDLFNIALGECTDEQERQELITKTLTKYYKGLAKEYKETNHDIIEANKATEEWNATVAEIGEEMAPVMTDIKRFGVALLEEVKDPMKDIADFISDDFLPALRDTGNWAKNNIPTIKAGMIGLTTAFVAYKAAVVAAEVSQKGLKGAIMATAAAEKALQLVQAATPWGLVITALSAVTAGCIAYGTAQYNAAKDAEVMTAAERELLKAAQDTAAELREQRAASDEAGLGALSQMAHVSDLAEELSTLADASGKVQENDQARVEFILNELNEALGTEYTMTDGVIQKYDELSKSINEVIAAKTANALLEAYNAEYVASIQAETTLIQGLSLAEQDYYAQMQVVAEKEAEVAKVRKQLQEETALAKETGDYRALQSTGQTLMGLELALEGEKKILSEKEQAYNDAAYAYGENSMMIQNYDDAQAAAMEGNYEKVKELLLDKGTSFGNYSETVDEATANVLDTLYKEAVDAGIEAERTKKNFERGIDGYTAEMVKEAEKGYEDALDEWANAYADAESVGEELGGGLGAGMENKRSSLLVKARNIVENIIGAFRDEADSHSPSRKMISFGEDMGEGAEIGIENKTKDLKRTAQHQVSAILDTYNERDTHGQTVLRGIQAATRVPSAVTETASDQLGLFDKLDKILLAIEKGQILTLDGKALVGGTAESMDGQLGQRRALVARGAI